MRFSRILALFLCLAGPLALTLTHMEGAGAAKPHLSGERKTMADITPAQRAATIKRNTIKGSVRHLGGRKVVVTGRIEAIHADAADGSGDLPTRFVVRTSVGHQ